MRAKLRWQAAVLAEVEVLGHAPVAELCVATSCLLRSSAQALQSLEANDLLEWSLELQQEGQFSWQLQNWPEELHGRLQGISLVLAIGLRSLASDYLALKLVEEGLFSSENL